MNPPLGEPCTQWWQALRADPLAWLLDDRHPNVAWRVLVELVERPVEAPAVRRMRGGAGAAEPVASLLEHLHPDGTWNLPSGEWTPFGGAWWHLVAAVRLGADPTDPRVGAGLRRLLEEDDGMEAADPCARARALEAACRLGWADHPVVAEALARFEAGARSGWTCVHDAHHDSDGRCRVTAVALLAASSAAPARRPYRELREAAAARITRWLAGYGDPAAVPWRPGFPNLLRTDPLEALEALVAAGRPWDADLHPVLAAVQLAQDGEGRWRTSAEPEAFGGLEGWDPPGRPSRWLTLSALRVLRAWAVPAGLPVMMGPPPAA